MGYAMCATDAYGHGLNVFADENTLEGALFASKLERELDNWEFEMRRIMVQGRDRDLNNDTVPTLARICGHQMSFTPVIWFDKVYLRQFKWYGFFAIWTALNKIQPASFWAMLMVTALSISVVQRTPLACGEYRSEASSPV